MADTPRGPRPTVSRPIAALLAATWLATCALLVVAAVAPARMHEDGWSRHRLDIVNMPYGDCSDEDTCTIHPTVELPSGDLERVRLVIAHESELLPSAHFRTGGTLELWLHDDPDRHPRSSQPTSAAGEDVSWWALFAAGLLTALGILVTFRARRAHDPGHAGHVADHVAVRVLPLLVLVVALALFAWSREHSIPRHDPRLPEPPAPTS